jgi:hypothetical protein
MIAIISKKRKLSDEHLNQNQKNIAKKLKKKKAGKFSGAKTEKFLIKRYNGNRITGRFNDGEYNFEVNELKLIVK